MSNGLLNGLKGCRMIYHNTFRDFNNTRVKHFTATNEMSWYATLCFFDLIVSSQFRTNGILINGEGNFYFPSFSLTGLSVGSLSPSVMNPKNGLQGAIRFSGTYKKIDIVFSEAIEAKNGVTLSVYKIN